ncbi:hypothetical protein C8R44DRAFT_789257 [Mycena epipterygia]|nr:hypothetical protein C8R44DRAFT_789257 [Mycena epipterygia]
MHDTGFHLFWGENVFVVRLELYQPPILVDCSMRRNSWIGQHSETAEGHRVE